MVNEVTFYRWAALTNACIVAGKVSNKPWSIRVTAICPVTREKIGCIATGTDETIQSAMDVLLRAPEISKAITRPKISRLLSSKS